MFSFKTDTIIHISLYTYGCKLKSRCRTESHLIPKLYLLSFFDLFKTLFQNQFKHFFIFRKQFFGKRCNSYGKTYLGKPRFVCTYLYLSKEHRQQFNSACKQCTPSNLKNNASSQHEKNMLALSSNFLEVAGACLPTVT